MKRDHVILKPTPIKGFSHSKVFYIPVDTPSGVIKKHLQQKALQEIETPFGHFYLLEDKVVLYRCVGASLAVVCLERLIVSGAKEICLLGYCGSLELRFRFKKVVSLLKAFSEEGTSRHYWPRRRVFYSSIPLRKKIEKSLRERNISFLRGTSVSTDAPYRETESWMRTKQEKGIELVDMESSAVFALAEFYGIQASAVMIISDELFSGKWDRGAYDKAWTKHVKDCFLPFLEIMTKPGQE